MIFDNLFMQEFEGPRQGDINGDKKSAEGSDSMKIHVSSPALISAS